MYPGGGLPVLLAGLRRSRGRGRRPARCGWSGRTARSRHEGFGRVRQPRAGPLVGGAAGDGRCGHRPGGRAAARQLAAAVRRASAPMSRACARCWRWPSGPAASSTMPARAGCWPIVRAMQDGGWVTATLAEVRNRADLVLFVGTDAQAMAPRFVERCLAPTTGAVRAAAPRARLSRAGRRRCAGAERPRPAPPTGSARSWPSCAPSRPAHRSPPTTVGGAAGRGAAAAGRAAASGALPGHRLGGARPAGQPSRPAHRHAGRPAPRAQRQGPLLRRAAGRRPTTSSAPTRSAPGRPAVPLRTSFASGAPDHDPVRWTTEALLDCRRRRLPGLDQQLRHASRCRRRRRPTIALVRPGHAAAVGRRGRDPGRHAGPRPCRQRLPHRRRGGLPLRALRDAGLPSAADVLAAIRQPSRRRGGRHDHQARRRPRLRSAQRHRRQGHGPVDPGRPDRRAARRTAGRTR